MVDNGCRGEVMEVSSHGIDQQRVGAVAFDVAIFTNLTQDHLDYHRTIENYFAAKRAWFDELVANPLGKKPIAVINIDDPAGVRLAEELKGTVLGCGTGEEAEIRALAIDVAWSGTQVKLTGRYLEHPLTLHTPLIGRTNGMNLLLAAAIGLELGLPAESVAGGAGTFALQSGQVLAKGHADKKRERTRKTTGLRDGMERPTRVLPKGWPE